MNALKAFMSSVDKQDILLPVLRSWLSKQAAKEEKDRSLRLAGVRKDAKLSIAAFKHRFNDSNHDDPELADYFHPSGIGACPRAIAYRAFGAPVDKSTTGADLLRSHLVFEVGTYFHVLFQNLCHRAGVLKAREVGVRDDIMKVIGHADGILHIKKQDMLLEIKTINQRQFTLLTAPKPEHIEQATMYLHYLKLKLALIVYYCKEDSALKEFRVPYSAPLANSLFQRIESTRGFIRRRILPSKDGKLPGKPPCMYCPYQRVCHDTEASKKYIAEAKLKDTK